MQSRRCRLVALCVLLWCAACYSPRTPSATVSTSRLRVCSQNLHRYGEQDKRWSPAKQREQLAHLLTRMHSAKCDVVALQEVIGADHVQASAVAREIAAELSDKRERPYVAVVADSRDRFLRNAVLYRSDLFTMVEADDLARKPLPRLQSIRGATGFYSRGPLFVRLRMTASKVSRPDLLVVTMHFKSKAGSYRDVTGTSYELQRMEMAAGLRKEVEKRLAADYPPTVPVLLGDRNSDADSPTAAILIGERSLADFRSGDCSITAQLRAECRRPAPAAPWVALIQTQRRSQRHRRGSHLYRGRQSLLDDIVMRAVDLVYVPGFRSGAHGTGLEGDFTKGSDHKLLWVELDFSDLTASAGSRS